MNIVGKMWEIVDEVIAANKELKESKVYSDCSIIYNIWRMLKAGMNFTIAEIKLYAIDIIIILGRYNI
jgi:hypothetical protein